MAAVPTLGRASSVEGALAREADLTRALYEQYAAQIFRYCLHQLGSREEAEDAVQSTFLNAFRGLKRGVVPELESAWLFKIAHNVCLSRRRSSWRRGRIEAPTDFDVVEELAPAPSRRGDELIDLRDVLEALPEQQRRAILLREWQGLSYREIADELELSQAAVETLIFRARRSLAQGLEQPHVAQRKRRQRLGASVVGNLLSSAQSFFVGGSAAAVKVAATVAVVSAGTVVATAPVQHAPKRHPHAKVPAKTHAVAAKPRPSQPSPAAAQPARVAATPAAHHRRPAAPHVARHAVTSPVAPPVQADPAPPVLATPAVDPPAPVVTTPVVATPAPPAEPAPQPAADSHHSAPADDSSRPSWWSSRHEWHAKTNAPEQPADPTGPPAGDSQPAEWGHGRHRGAGDWSDHGEHGWKSDHAAPVDTPTTTPVTTTPAMTTATTTVPSASSPAPAPAPVETAQSTTTQSTTAQSTTTQSTTTTTSADETAAPPAQHWHGHGNGHEK